MFNYEKAVKAVNKVHKDIFNSESYCGTCSYYDENFGKVEFSFQGNRSRVKISFTIAEPVCQGCGQDPCFCDLDFYLDEPEENYEIWQVFNKDKWQKIVSNTQLKLL